MGDHKATLTFLAKDAASAAVKDIHGAVVNLSGSAGKLGSVLQGIGQGIGQGIFGAFSQGVRELATAIPDMISRGLDFTNLVDELGDSTGAAAEDTSRLIGTYQLLGVSTDNLGTRMGQLAKVVVNNEAAVNAYGIATRDSSGHLLNQVQIVENARSTLSKYADGTTKASVMTKLFGRAGLDMADYLSLSDKQVQLITGDLKQMGVVLSSEAAKKAEAAKIELRRFDLVMQGLANQLVSLVLPAIIAAANGLANWVRDNGRQIAAFAAQVVNFVLGMVAALTGATFSTVSFTEQLGEVGVKAEAAGNSLDGMGTKATSGGARSTAAIDRQVAAVDRLISAVQRQEAAQDRAFEKERSRQDAALDRQLAALDAEERALGIADRRAELADAIARAQDPEQLAAAQKAAADYEAQLARDAKRDQIQTTKEQVDEVFKLYEDTENKKAVASTLTRLLANREKDLALARERGDAAEVGRLTAVTEAMRTTIARAEQAARNADREADLTKQKEHFEELKKAAAGAATGPSGVGPVMQKGAGMAQVAVQEMSEKGIERLKLMRESIDPEGGQGGLTGAMEAARLAGMAFGKDLHDALVGKDGKGGALKALQDIAGSLMTILGFLRDIAAIPGAAWENLKAIDENVRRSTSPYAPGGETIPGPSVVPPGLFGPGKASGGPVLAGRAYIVGEHRSELFVPHQDGMILPSVPTGGGTLAVTINVSGAGDPAAVARNVLQELKREANRQGMTLAPSAAW